MAKRKEAENMKYAVVYESATGNTKMLADEIRDTLGEENCVCFGTPGENMTGGAHGGRNLYVSGKDASERKETL